MVFSTGERHHAHPPCRAARCAGPRGGGSGYLPEHTLEAYALGIELGADFVEPDLVATKDGHLIARHEPNLIATTNVRSLPQFASRRRTAVLDGIPTDGFWASGFTLAEIKTLRAIQPVGARGAAFDGQFQIPTLEEVIALAKNKTRVKLVQLVDADDLAADGSITFAAPFDKPYDWAVSGRSGLFKDLLTPAGLAEVRTYADGIGPWKYCIQSTACQVVAASGGCADTNGDGAVNEADRVTVPATDLVARAHAAGLLVHTWTFRNERNRQPLDDSIQPTNEVLRFYSLGVDGVFSDFADTAFAARVLFKLKADPSYARCLVRDNGCTERD